MWQRRNTGRLGTLGNEIAASSDVLGGGILEMRGLVSYIDVAQVLDTRSTPFCYEC